MVVREKLVDLIVWIEDQMTRAYPYTTDQFRIETTVSHLIANGVTVQEFDGCKYCKEYEDLPEHFIDGKSIGRVFDTCIQPNENGLWHIEVPCGADIGIKFCPMCGRRLPQPPKGE